MRKVNIYEAQTRLSELIEEAASGHDVVIARAGRPVTRLTRLARTGGWLVRLGASAVSQCHEHLR